MQQQMPLQQQIMQPQMMEPMQIQLNNNRNKSNFVFYDTSSKKLTNLYVDVDISIKELIDKYMAKVFGYEKKDIYFLYNAKRIDRNSQIKLRKFFEQNPKIAIYYIGEIKEN